MSTQFLKSSLENAIASGHLLLMDYTQASVAFAAGAVDTTSNEIDLGASFLPMAVVGTRLAFSGLSATTDLLNSTVYYVVGVVGTEVQLSLTPGGTPINLTVAASGSVSDVAPVSSGGLDIRTEVETVADAVRYEVASYQALTSRPAFTDSGTATLVRDTTANQWVAQLTDNVAASTATPIGFNYSLIVQGGSATPGNTTGTVARAFGNGTPQSVGVGGVITVTLSQEGF